MLYQSKNVFILSVCVPVQAITFECLDMETSFFVQQYILTISRSSSSIKGHWVKVQVTLAGCQVIGQVKK